MAERIDWETLWQPKPAPPPPTTPTVAANPGGNPAYAQAALDREINDLRATPEGKRNTQLNESAFNLAQLVASNHLDHDDTWNWLRATAQRIGLPNSEIESTLRSAFRAGLQKPRTVPAPTNGATPAAGRLTPVEPPTIDDQTAVDRRYLQLTAALLDATGLANITPPTPLVDGYLYRDSLAWLGGKPGHAKSFIAIELACCIATGQPWHGQPTQPGPVLYVIAEGTAGFAQRVEAWTTHTQQQPGKIRFLPVPVQMMDPVDIAAFSQIVADLTPSLVVFDTQARVTVGAEENSSRDMGRFVDALDELRRQSQACILAVHHEPRNGENLRGSTALEGAATTILRANKDGNIVTLTNPKQKDTPEQEALTLTLQPVSNSAVLIPATGEQAETSETEKHILIVLDGFGPNGATKTELRDAVDLTKSSWYRAINVLVKKGLVSESFNGRSGVYKLSDGSGGGF